MLKYCVYIWCLKDAAHYRNSHRLVHARPENVFLFIPDKDEYFAVKSVNLVLVY